MNVLIKYDTLALSQQLLERQRGHADKIAAYLPANADIGDATGLLLAAFDPLSKLAVDLGVQAANAVGQIATTSAYAVGDIARDVADTDGRVSDSFSKLMARIGHSGPGSTYPDLAGPPLGPAADRADGDYAHVDSYFWQKAYDAGKTAGDSVGEVESLVHDVSKWTSPGTVSEVADASSYLVPGQAPDNFVQNLRWSAGILLGGIDWVAEQFIGFSILDRCVYKPLAGDWQGIYRASEAWGHAGDAAHAIGRNHAGLVATTPPTWQGLSGNSFRAAMSGVAGACVELGVAYGTASDYVKTISTVCKLACVGIGAALQFITNKLLKMAAEAATPVIGWAVGAVTAYSDIQAVVNKVRLIYTIFETIMSAIKDFAEAKTAIFDKLSLLEDLLQGAVTSVAVS